MTLGVKNLPANEGDIRGMGSIPGMGRFPEERQYSSIFAWGIFMNIGSCLYSIWMATVHSVA